MGHHDPRPHQEIQITREGPIIMNDSIKLNQIAQKLNDLMRDLELLGEVIRQRHDDLARRILALEENMSDPIKALERYAKQ